MKILLAVLLALSLRGEASPPAVKPSARLVDSDGTELAVLWRIDGRCILRDWTSAKPTEVWPCAAR